MTLTIITKDMRIDFCNIGHIEDNGCDIELYVDECSTEPMSICVDGWMVGISTQFTLEKRCLRCVEGIYFGYEEDLEDGQDIKTDL